MKKTENYALNQWEAADVVRREDFNADNAAIDAALKANADAVAAAASPVVKLIDYTLPEASRWIDIDVSGINIYDYAHTDSSKGYLLDLSGRYNSTARCFRLFWCQNYIAAYNHTISRLANGSTAKCDFTCSMWNYKSDLQIWKTLNFIGPEGDAFQAGGRVVIYGLKL